MLKSSLLNIVRTFNSDEFERFSEFLRSPYFNKKDNVILLFDEIKKYHPGYDDPELNREKIWKKIFPGKKFNYGIMKNTIYDLMKLCERFITIEHYGSDELRTFADLTEALDKRYAAKVLSTRLLTFEKNFNSDHAGKSGMQIQDYYHALSKMYWLKLANTYNDSGSEDEQIAELGTSYMLSAFLINMYTIYDSIRLIRFIKNKESDTVVLKKILDKINGEVISHLKTLKGTDADIMNCYHAMYASVRDPGDLDAYYRYKLALSNAAHLFNKADFRNMCIYLNNSMINQTSLKINKEVESLYVYDMLIDNGVFRESSGIVPDNVFNNYILNKSSSFDADGMEEFIKQFIGDVPENKRENCRLFAEAHLSFIRGDHARSLELISMINLSYFDLKYYLKNLQMMNYYELDDYEGFILAFDSYKHFAENNRNVQDVLKKRITSFYKTTKHLFSLRKEFDEYECRKLRDVISSAQIARRSWLTKKLDELELMNKTGFKTKKQTG